MRIDAHHHLWRYDAEEFAWISDAASALRRDFLPEEFEGVLDAGGIDGAIAVQARCTVEETAWLLGCAGRCRKTVKVVGWAPLASPELPAYLDELVGKPLLAGFREIAQDKSAGFLLEPAFNDGIRQLTALGLTYDILIRAGQMGEAIQFADAHPRQKFVLDHAGKPEISAARLEPWRTQLRQLAQRPQVLCKLSGLVTEADWHTWTEESLEPYLDTCLEAFGPERCMVGSDWPVCLLASGYGRWWDTLYQWAEKRLSVSEQESVFGGTAAAFYGCGELRSSPGAIS